MDLRGFTAENKGCLYELGRISQTSHLTPVAPIGCWMSFWLQTVEARNICLFKTSAYAEKAR
ncbi:MAG: hypothetical protein ACK55E_10065 [Cyanobacteriota bacterium]|jgi:hypothetical protein